VIQNATAGASSAGLGSWIPEKVGARGGMGGDSRASTARRQTSTTRLVMPLVWLGCRFFAADWTR
jgi:hypothetical protein